MPELASLTLLGILYGATVCSLSCLPTLGPLLVGEGGGFRQGLRGALSFMSGKVLAYTLLGAVAAGIGREVPLEHPLTRIIPGIILVLTAAYLVFTPSRSCAKGTCPSTRGKFSFLALGATTGFTPCAPLVSVMLLAAQQGNLLAGAACGFFFGAGLMLSPMILAGGGLAFLSRKIRLEMGAWGMWVRRLAGAILLINGLDYFI